MTAPTTAYLQQLLQAHLQLARPMLVQRGLLPDGRVVDDTATSRDTEGGIDYTTVTPDGPVHIALRCRVDGHDWRSVTIRARTGSGSWQTEFHKRARAVLAAIHQDADTAYPALTVQDHYSPDLGTWLCSYVVRTRALYGHIVANPVDYLAGHKVQLCTCVQGPIRNPQDGALFYSVEWEDYHCAKAMGLVRCSVGLVTPPPAPEPAQDDPQLGLW